MKSIHLRKLQPRDLAHFAKWWRDDYLRSVTSGDHTKLSDKEVATYFKDMLDNTQDFHFMIEHDGKTIGHVSLNQRPNNWYETQIIIGKGQYRGHGYGPAAIDQLIFFAQEHNIKQMYLEVRPDNLPAISAYQKCGFKKVKTIERPNKPNLKIVIRMEL